MVWRRWVGFGSYAILAAACGGVTKDGPAQGSGGSAAGSLSPEQGGQPPKTTTGGSSAGYREIPVPGGVGGSGAPPIPSLPGHVECAQPSLDVPWPLVVTCVDGAMDLPADFTRLRCPFSKHVTFADYGAFVACCPIERPFSCADSTPWQCFATANQAAASCGTDNCVTCSEHEGDGAGGETGVDGEAGAGGHGGAF